KAHTQAKASKHDLSTLVQRFELERMQPYRAEPDGKLVWQLFQLLTTWQQVQQLEMPEKVAVETSVFTEAETQRLKIVKAATTTQPILTLLAADPLEAIREQAQQQLFARFEVVFDHADVQEAWIEAAQSQAYRVRMHVASLPQLPLEMMKILVRDSTVSVRKTLASNQNVPTSIAEQLLNDKAVNVREQAFNNPGIAPLLLAKHPKVTLEQLLILVKHEDGSVRQAVGGHKTSNEAILLHLVADPIVKIATAAQVRLLKTATLTSELKVLLLTAPHVTSEIFDTFGDDQNVQVRKALITHKQIPLALILALLDDQQHEIAYVAKQKLHERATHPNTQAHELQLLAECGDYSIQQAIASHPQTPPKTLGQLANLSFDNFSELKIGKALAANPQTPMGILLKLARIKSLRTQVYETITKKR
ncbi:MAG: hypothetical protein ACRCZC_03350, partial [Culicoidibacterales bacterium]